MSDHDSDDELWELLGKARPPQVSPFFARNVLRRIREREEGRPGWFVRLFAHRRWAAASALAAALLVMAGGSALFQHFSAPESAKIAAAPVEKIAEPVAEQIAESPDYEIIVQLDELLAYEKNDLWIDDSTTF